ncbi:MAG: hypothetical protein BWY82_02498 [Verrucomicrobia bacterium ADurb.Bin474]|nr:MAG: hypothetical protein BWY82_02498 [Verrucomicrobia bacterium ADurb.Bin474]
MLLEEGNHDHRVFAALAFVDADRIGELNLSEIGALVGDCRAVEINQHGRFDGINLGDAADVSVEDSLVVVILDLDHPVALAELVTGGSQGGLVLGCWIEGSLYGGVEVLGAGHPFVEGRKELHFPHP